MKRSARSADPSDPLSSRARSAHRRRRYGGRRTVGAHLRIGLLGGQGPGDRGPAAGRRGDGERPAERRQAVRDPLQPGPVRRSRRIEPDPVVVDRNVEAPVAP